MADEEIKKEEPQGINQEELITKVTESIMGKVGPLMDEKLAGMQASMPVPKEEPTKDPEPEQDDYTKTLLGHVTKLMDSKLEPFKSQNKSAELTQKLTVRWNALVKEAPHAAEFKDKMLELYAKLPPDEQEFVTNSTMGVESLYLKSGGSLTKTLTSLPSTTSRSVNPNEKLGLDDSAVKNASDALISGNKEAYEKAIKSA